MTASTAGYNDLVFINCPFDAEYQPLLHAIVYTIYRCGFVPQTALGEDDGTEFRLNKIMRIIENCRYGIHDVSRTELNDAGLPRFNMPFEAGLFFGAKRFGERQQKNKNALILDKERYRYMQFISDLNGIDAKAHKNDPDLVIEKVSSWLIATSKRAAIPGYRIIQREYRAFQLRLPVVIDEMGLDLNNIHFLVYCDLTEVAARAASLGRPKAGGH